MASGDNHEQLHDLNTADGKLWDGISHGVRREDSEQPDVRILKAEPAARLVIGKRQLDLTLSELEAIHRASGHFLARYTDRIEYEWGFTAQINGDPNLDPWEEGAAYVHAVLWAPGAAIRKQWGDYGKFLHRVPAGPWTEAK